MRAHFLRGAGRSSDLEAVDPCKGGGASWLCDSDECLGHIVGCFFWNNLPHDGGFLFQHDFAIFLLHGLDDARSHEVSTICYHSHAHRDLQWSHSNRVAHRHASDGEFVPAGRGMHESGDFSWQLDSEALSESEAADILVEFVSAHHEGHLGGTDVRGFHENLMDIHVSVAVVVLENAASVGKASVFTEDSRLFIDLAFIERACGYHDFECRSGFDHVYDRPVFHLLWLGFARLVRVETGAAGHRENGPGFWIHEDGVGGFGL